MYMSFLLVQHMLLDYDVLLKALALLKEGCRFF